MTRCPCDRAGLPVLPDGTAAAQCFLCDVREVNAEAIDALSQHPGDCPCLGCARAFGVAPTLRPAAPPARPWTVTVPEQAPTVRPPADQRCARCSRILIAAPCPCVTPVERAIASGRAHREDMARLTPAERIAAWRGISGVWPVGEEIL